jgi:hypothetical protein
MLISNSLMQALKNAPIDNKILKEDGKTKKLKLTKTAYPVLLFIFSMVGTIYKSLKVL